jgi:hypothetical protein
LGGHRGRFAYQLTFGLSIPAHRQLTLSLTALWGYLWHAMKTFLLCVACASLLVGCKPAATPPPPIAPTNSVVEPWRTRGEEMKNRIKVGMTDSEVEKLLGEPTDHHTSIRGDVSETIWLYRLAPNTHLKVQFDRYSTVVDTKITSPVPVQ